MDFAKIYSSWVNTHNEDTELSERRQFPSEDEGKEGKEVLSLNSIRRMNVQAELDLHGMTLEQSVNETDAFLDRCRERGFLKVRIITGKGIHSPEGKCVIRPEILERVRSKSCVREVNTKPKSKDGGSGALIVLLKDSSAKLST